MNEKEEENILLVVKQYNDICIDVIFYNDFLRKRGRLNFELETRIVSLKNGFYGTLMGKTKCWVSKSVALNCIKVPIGISRKENNPQPNWSLDVKLEDFDPIATPKLIAKQVKMKAFW